MLRAAAPTTTTTTRKQRRDEQQQQPHSTFGQCHGGDLSLAELEAAVEEARARVENLRRENRATGPRARTYQGEWGPAAYSVDRLPLYWAMRDIAVGVVDRAVAQLSERNLFEVVSHPRRTADELEEMAERQAQLDAKAQKGFVYDEKAELVLNALTLESCSEAVAAIHDEMQKTDALCVASSRDVLLSVVFGGSQKNKTATTTAAGFGASASSTATSGQSAYEFIRARRNNTHEPARRMVRRSQHTAAALRALVKTANPLAPLPIRVHSGPQTIAAHPRLDRTLKRAPLSATVVGSELGVESSHACGLESARKMTCSSMPLHAYECPAELRRYASAAQR
jgi:hypothetical protein